VGTTTTTTKLSNPQEQQQQQPPLHETADRRINGTIRLVTWNLLAPVYSHPKKYPWSSADYLDWSYRGPLIQSELTRMDADIVCLQEVQTDTWDTFISGLDENYEGILQNVTNDHPVTNAVLLRKNKFRVIDQESRSRALLLVLGESNTTNDTDTVNPRRQPLYLANVHLQAGIDDDDTRVSQLKSLLKRLVFHINGNKKDTDNTTKKRRLKQKAKSLVERVKVASSKTDKSLLILGRENRTIKADVKNDVNQEDVPPAVIIAGDMNMLPTNPVYRWLSHKDHKTASSNDQTQRAPRVHMRDPGTGLRLDNLKFPIVGKHIELLPLTDVYRRKPPVLYQTKIEVESLDPTESKEQKAKPISMTYCGGSVLDYVWTTTSSSRAIDITKTMVFHPQAFENEPQQWPSKDHPSDHLPLGVEFSWRSQ